MRLFRVAFVLVVAACGSKTDTPEPSAVAPALGSKAPTGTGEQLPAPANPVFPEGTRSAQLIRTVSVRLEASDASRRIGTIAIDTRVGWTRSAKGKGCKKNWIQIHPRGWVCSDYLVASKKPPLGREVPQLDRGEVVPGTYGKVVGANQVTYQFERASTKTTKKKQGKDKASAPITSTTELEPAVTLDDRAGKMVEDAPLVGSMTVRKYDELTVGGKLYWKVAKKANEYLLQSAIHQHKPSTFAGARLADDTGITGPVAFVWPRGSLSATYTMRKANGGGIARSRVAKRTPITLLETANDKAGKPAAYRIGPAEWIRAADVRVFTPAPPPAQLREGERWIDIDLDTQILVAYEGALAVYATMVSSGLKDTPTTTGTFRMWLKESEADMKNLKREDPYSVATVPWTQFFYPEEDLAIHTAYWHDLFGTPRSHGCVNVAPKDARWLYFWSDPLVPPGWTMAAGVVEAPGSIVRVRSKADPDPEIKGYAKKVDEARRANPR